MVDGTTHNNTEQRFFMSTDRQAIVDAFIQRQREQFQQLIGNLTVYYEQFRSHLLILSEKSNQRYLFLTILLSFTLVTLLSLLIFEHRRVFQALQRCLRAISLFSRFVVVRASALLLRKSTPPILNVLLNSASPIRQKFAHELRRALNQEFLQRKVSVDRCFPHLFARRMRVRLCTQGDASPKSTRERERKRGCSYYS